MPVVCAYGTLHIPSSYELYAMCYIVGLVVVAGSGRNTHDTTFHELHSKTTFPPFSGRARFASRGGAPNKNIGFPRGGVVPPRDLRGLSRGGVGLTPQEAEEGQTPQKLRLERGKEANDSQFPLESHFFTTNFMN